MKSRPTIEDIILDRDRRGISDLRSLLPEDYCEEAAKLLEGAPGTVFIVTGFYIPDLGAPETDGPPGAILLGRALEAMDWRVTYLTDRFSAGLMSAVSGGTVLEFPMPDEAGSEAFAEDLLSRHAPDVLVSVERCGLTQSGRALNMRGRDISACNAAIDTLFEAHPRTIGIADGGNEIGMGNLAAAVAAHPALVDEPCVTPVTALILASVSNWGALGLIAALSLRARRDLLPTTEEEMTLIRACLDHGAVDGLSLSRAAQVDGFSLEENALTLTGLRDLVRQELS